MKLILVMFFASNSCLVVQLTGVKFFSFNSIDLNFFEKTASSLGQLLTFLNTMNIINMNVTQRDVIIII